MENSYLSQAMDGHLSESPSWHSSLPEWGDLLLHLLMLGELEASAELVIVKAKELMKSGGVGAKNALGRLAMLLGEKASQPPFAVPSDVNMSRVSMQGNVRDKWRRDIVEVSTTLYLFVFFFSFCCCAFAQL